MKAFMTAADAVKAAEHDLTGVFAGIDEREYLNAARVLDAFREERIAARHFSPTTGYGYDDVGRDALDAVFARAMQAESALVRPQIVSGTHAIYLALSGLTEAGDTVVSASGLPYDTLHEAIGIRGDAPSSLAHQGVRFSSVKLTPSGFNTPAVLDALRGSGASKLLYVQRSRGYSWRNALMPRRDMAPLFAAVKREFPNCIIFVDNCYGEFVCAEEPTACGADVIAGSLIKNPGGGLAPTGGYVAGKAALIEKIAYRLTVPGMGREIGSYAGGYGPFFQGLFMAPHTVAQSLKTAALFARLFELCSLESLPPSNAERSDIVQSLRFASADSLVSFCRSIQSASPVDSFVVPEPWDMPGYDAKVIMAAGAFVQGASIELSADAPMREPYTAYLQGALTYSHGRIAAMRVLDGLLASGLVSIDPEKTVRRT